MSLADELLADLEDGDDEEMVEESELPRDSASEANEVAQNSLIQSLKGIKYLKVMLEIGLKLNLLSFYFVLRFSKSKR